ncbi:MAG: nucleoside-diphosphate-sugar epimerase [Neolewinella sp.]
MFLEFNGYDFVATEADSTITFESLAASKTEEKELSRWFEIALVRGHSMSLLKEAMQVVNGDLNSWATKSYLLNSVVKKILKEIDLVTHTAARVHVMADTSNDPLTEFRALNTDATFAFARIASDSGVRRFIFISSVKVNGEMTEHNE